MTKLAVFDVDGTILDSIGMFMRVIGDYSAEAGLPQPCLETIRIGYANSRAHDFKWGVTPEEQERHLNNTFKMMDQWSISVEPDKAPKLYHGVSEGLKRLKNAGHTLAIVTSKPEAPLQHMLRQENLTGLFSAHRTWDDIKRRGEREKPSPEMLQSVMRELSFAPAQTVMIGDTTMDIGMGRSANTNTIGVTWGSHKRPLLEEAGAHHIVERHFDDVVETVARIFA